MSAGLGMIKEDISLSSMKKSNNEQELSNSGSGSQQPQGKAAEIDKTTNAEDLGIDGYLEQTLSNQGGYEPGKQRENQTLNEKQNEKPSLKPANSRNIKSANVPSKTEPDQKFLELIPDDEDSIEEESPIS